MLEEVSGLALVGHVGPELYRVPVRVVPQVAAGGQRRVYALPPDARVDLESTSLKFWGISWGTFLPHLWLRQPHV